ncbi:hypothetical protein [Alteromonas gilva]|uniref:DUF4942 domain-containing protein n=1 Tax=Alteromonas gilva TaxID=2987522 RepID=A0ABT5L7E6_9ALTE|nr:hypothetical protein [Alteromonas gilva]MDC8832798.1 hypothetical protein [Alteromonas gilva]
MKSKGIKSAAEYKCELGEIIELVHSESVGYQKAAKELAALTGKAFNRIYPGEVLKTALNTWLERICKEVSISSQGDTNKEFMVNEFDESLSKIGEVISAPINSSYFDDDSLYRYRELVSQYPYEILVKTLKRFSEDLEVEGFKDIAGDVIRNLNLAMYKHHSHETSFFKLMASRVCWDIRTQRDNVWEDGRLTYQSRERITVISEGLAAIEKQTGVTGLSKPFSDIADMFNDGQVIGSGSVFGCKNTLEVRVFNNHSRVTITRDALSSLMAFLVINKPENIDIKYIPEQQQRVA